MRWRCGCVGVENEVGEECWVVNGDVGAEERREQGEGEELAKVNVEEKTSRREEKGRKRKRRK